MFATPTWPVNEDIVWSVKWVVSEVYRGSEMAVRYLAMTPYLRDQGWASLLCFLLRMPKLRRVGGTTIVVWWSVPTRASFQRTRPIAVDTSPRCSRRNEEWWRNTRGAKNGRRRRVSRSPFPIHRVGLRIGHLDTLCDFPRVLAIRKQIFPKR